MLQSLPVITKEAITHTQLVRYAGASGDFNPIHTVVPLAEKAGLGGVIAHGMLIMGFAGQALTTWFTPAEIRSFQVRFSSMTRPGEVLSIEGAILKEEEKDGVTLQNGEIVIKNQEGDVKLKGSFERIKR